MNELFEAWKAAQKNGPRLGRSNEDALWKRFRSARTVFDRHRRAYFSQLDNENAEAKRAKEALIARAEALSTSTDWGDTSADYRRLIDESKASKRANRRTTTHSGHASARAAILRRPAGARRGR